MDKKKELEEEDSPIEALNKKKDTVWKIIMPGKNRKYATFTEQKVVREIESLIDKQPLVQKSLTQLKEIDEAIQNSSPNQSKKNEYTSKKNRISAQLSRDRRSAIVQSLMELCVSSMEQKEELEGELEGARDILKKSLCTDCKDALKTGTKNTKKKSQSSGITVKGKGNAFIMSLLAVSVAMVAVYAPGQVGPSNQATSLITGPAPQTLDLPDLSSTRMHGRNLMSTIQEDLDTALQVYEQPQ